MTDRRTVLHARRRGRGQAGFTFIEVMASVAVLTIGLVGLLAVSTYAIAVVHATKQDTIAKRLANEAMESIVTARDSSEYQWLQIQNVGAGTTPDGIFLTGWQQICTTDPTEGLQGTAKNEAMPARKLQEPGPDGIFGTADDISVSLAGFTRQIVITPVSGTDTLRQVTISVQYPAAPFSSQKVYTLSSYISQFR